jgi:hypothetical protein
MTAILATCRDCGVQGHAGCEKRRCDRYGIVFDGIPARMYGQASQIARAKLTKHQITCMQP